MEREQAALKDVKRFAAWEQDRVRKLEAKRQEKKDPAVEECSFAPKINRSENERPRTKEQFLADQQAFLERQNLRHERIRQEVAELECPHKPQLMNPQPKKKKGEKQVHDRLYHAG